MAGRRPPRLLMRTMAVTFVTVLLLLIVVFLVVTVSVRRQVRDSVRVNLEAVQRVFATFEARHQRELAAQAATLSDNPALKAALDTYQAEARTADPANRAILDATIDGALDSVASRIDVDAVVLVDQQGNTIASAGRLKDRWPRGQPVALAGNKGASTFDGIATMGAASFRAVAVPLQTLTDVTIGTMYLTNILDQSFAQELDRLAGTRTAIVSRGRVLATTLPGGAAQAFEAQAAQAPLGGQATLAGEEYAYRALVNVADDTAFYALGSIDESSVPATRDAMRSLGLIGLGAIALALVGSLWLARLLAEPIGKLSGSLAQMTATHDLDARLKPTGTSREVDGLIETFNGLMASLSTAEEQTQAAYTGAIRALAIALDARDQYTAGHSERVSVLSVAIGRRLALNEEDLEVLRLGALLHDIGKIGVPDNVLMKPGPLTDPEFEAIKQHPVLGARILRPVPFLAPHIPIVELHHERPDGRGYPHRMRDEDIPLAARIVHVADAYDAMTSARAYRTARTADVAMKELHRCSGSEFHADIVAALATALPGITTDTGLVVLEHA